MDQILILIGGALIGLVGKIIYDIFLVERRKSIRKVLEYECNLWKKHLVIVSKINDAFYLMKWRKPTHTIDKKNFRMLVREIAGINIDELEYKFDNLIVRLNHNSKHTDFFSLWKCLLVRCIDIFIELDDFYEELEKEEIEFRSSSIFTEDKLISKKDIIDNDFSIPKYDTFMKYLYNTWSGISRNDNRLKGLRNHVDKSKEYKENNERFFNNMDFKELKFFYLMDKFREEGFDMIIKKATWPEIINSKKNQKYYEIK
jgi:hypothetical protein